MQETKYLSLHFCFSGIMLCRNVKYLHILWSMNRKFVLCDCLLCWIRIFKENRKRFKGLKKANQKTSEILLKMLALSKADVFLDFFIISNIANFSNGCKRMLLDVFVTKLILHVKFIIYVFLVSFGLIFLGKCKSKYWLLFTVKKLYLTFMTIMKHL